MHRRCDPATVPFETTSSAAAPGDFVGQERAAEAVRFGITVKREGYNLFAMGPPGVGKETLLKHLLARQAVSESVPSDWCYVHNFREPYRPRALKLPPGRGAVLAAGMERAVADLAVALRAAFESEEYRTRKQQRVAAFKQGQEAAFTELEQRARSRHVALVRTDTGVMIAPMRDGAALDPQAFERLPEADRTFLRAEMERTGEEVQAFLGKLHEWGRQQIEELKALDRDTASKVARRVIDRVREDHANRPAVLSYLAEVEQDVVAHAEDFLDGEATAGLEAAMRRAFRPAADGTSFRRYAVNVIIDNGSAQGVPVVFEAHPTHAAIVGRVEHVPQFGAFVTDFTLIKPGALHGARGGYLILEAMKVLQHPFAWDALKRALRSGEIRIESPGQGEGLVPTASLEPDPIPLAGTKIVLIGERSLYYLLAKLDPDFLELFKVLVDFDESIDRTEATEAGYAHLIATLIRKEGLRPMGRTAVARVIEHASRLAGDGGKLSVHMRPIADLVHETDAFAGAAGREVATAEDIEAAIEAQRRRAGRVRETLLEAVKRGSILIATDGERIGQVNGLSVLEIGEHPFGHPARITARARVGKGEVVDIEREVALGGPIHSKGVLILGGFLTSRYAVDFPLSLSATVVFEQSYGGVEGDSASLAETCALLSALARIPVRQSLAVTGSINQHGDVQVIGGVNEKIEGFFDVCREQGLTGRQGVVIPEGNVKDLMLREDIVQAVREGRFAVYAARRVDDAAELLMGRPAGERRAEGAFPEGSVNAAVEARLAAFAEITRTFLSRSPGQRT